MVALRFNGVYVNVVVTLSGSVLVSRFPAGS